MQKYTQFNISGVSVKALFAPPTDVANTVSGCICAYSPNLVMTQNLGTAARVDELETLGTF